jgi:hypothetical protein
MCSDMLLLAYLFGSASRRLVPLQPTCGSPWLMLHLRSNLRAAASQLPAMPQQHKDCSAVQVDSGRSKQLLTRASAAAAAVAAADVACLAGGGAICRDILQQRAASQLVGSSLQLWCP